MNIFLSRVDSIFNTLEHFWEHKRTERIAANILIIVFIGTISLIELRRHGWLPEGFAETLPASHYYAIKIAFSMLLALEVLSLVFSIAKSVADAVGKQFEILSLILLRQSFKEFIYFNEPIQWEQASKPVLHILSDAGGGLIIFLLLGVYYKLQRHRAITLNPIAAANFIASKKLVSLVMLTIFTGMSINTFILYLNHQETADFFATFYTILVFSDVLLVLVSLRYSSSYQVVFRNSGFAVGTVVVRLALTAPPYINVLLGVGAIIFAIGITVAYNIFVEKNDNQTAEASAPHLSPNHGITNSAE